MKQVKFQLKNKLKVLLIQSQKSPVVSVQMWVKTGSADEKKGEEGISHFIEHLVFKGSDKYKVGEIANIVEASGGELNAYTSFDQTVFYVTISKSYSDVALDVISQMMGYPLFDPAEVDSEREVVCEEIKMGKDSPQRRSSQLLFSTAFKKHSYGIPVIGYDKNVRSWSAKKIKSFYQSRYVPSNMFLVVSGDFEISEMKEKVSQYFSSFKPFKLETRKRATEPVQKKFTSRFEKSELQDQHLHFSFKAPSVKHKDVPALDVLSMILGHGDSSRLVKKLRLNEPVATAIAAFNYNPQDKGLFVFSAQFEKGKFDAVTEGILNEIDQIQNNLPLWSEIKRARVSISSEQFYSIETVDGIANKAGSLEFYLGDPNGFKKYLAAINKITPVDVQKVARKYLKLDQLSVSYMANEDKKRAEAKLLEISKTWKKKIFLSKAKVEKSNDKKLKIENLALPAHHKKSHLEVEEISLASGMKIFMLPTEDIPTVSAKLAFRGGARMETPDKMGLSELMSRVWFSGTKGRSEERFLAETEDLALGISAFTGKNTFGFSLEYLTGFEKKSLELAIEAITKPLLSEPVIQREKEILFQQIKAKVDHPSYLCSRQFHKAMFGNHPLAYESLGTVETLTSLHQNDLVDLKNRILSPDNLTMTVVGQFDKSQWIDMAHQMEESFSKKGQVSNGPAPAPLAESKRVFLEKDKEQTHVIIGYRGIPITDPDRFVLHTIQAVLAGQGGRLFYELRDKSSLAYSVSPVKMESVETGYFGGYIACSPEKVEKAIEMFQVEFKKICDTLVGAEELDRAKKYLIGQHDIGLQRKSAICNLIVFDEVYGNDYHKSLNVVAEYEKVTAKRIQDLAMKLFTKPNVISIVGRELK
ncbi:MAG: zinc protease [Bdellovibrionales bacterium RIFCSPHIGHO2_01_FULL_40_29]|nr:MAG: zinc protease [Bdellovibrionales bacterium RIFCSPHIGHO2_01_FULL_40_29]